MADCLSRHPSELEGASISAETLWNEWFTVNSLNTLNNVLENWREKFQSFSVDEKDLLYMDNCSVIPQPMRSMIMCSLHYGHPGRDSMLAMIEDIWWPRIHREIIDQARLCEQCLESGKNSKCILGQKQIGKLP